MAKSKNAKPVVPVIDPAQMIADNDEKLKLYSKWAIFLLIAGILISLLVGYINSKSAQSVDTSSKVMGAFETSTLQDFKDKKINTLDFINKSKSTINELGSSNSFLVVASEAFDAIKKDTTSQDQAIEFFNFLKTKSSHELSSYYYSLYSSVLNEDKGNYKEAIRILKSTLSSSLKLEEKTYLDLGRLHLLDGQTDQAKSNFQHLLKNFPASKEANLAKIFANENSIILE